MAPWHQFGLCDYSINCLSGHFVNISRCNRLKGEPTRPRIDAQSTSRLTASHSNEKPINTAPSLCNPISDAQPFSLQRADAQKLLPG